MSDLSRGNDEAMTAPSVSERLRELRSCGNHPCDCWQCSSIEALATEIEEIAEEIRNVEEEPEYGYPDLRGDQLDTWADALAPQKEGT